MAVTISSLLGVIIFSGIVAWWGRHRAPGTPLTWGEAFVGALFVLAFMLLVYGILPTAWLSWADGALKWRSDKIGIPIGPLHYLPGVPGPGHQGKVLFFIPIKNNLLWPTGLTFFGRGKVNLAAVDLRDLVATLIYVVGLGGQLYAWSWWQKRGQRKVETPELTSAYGRPLVRKA